MPRRLPQCFKRLGRKAFGPVAHPEHRVKGGPEDPEGGIQADVSGHVLERCACGEVLSYARIQRRSQTFIALLCATLMATQTSGGDARLPPTGSSEVTRVMIVDDHPVVRVGLRTSLLSFPDFEIVGEASSGEEAVRLFAEVRPDIILMDLVMPGMGGIFAIRAILDIAPDAKIMVVSSFEEGDRVQEAFEAGAIGYQLKGVEIEDLVTAIRQTVSGIPSLAPAAVQSLVRNTRKARKLGDDLTDRERQVLVLLARGLSNPAIADRMVITVATVKFHLHSIRSKLGTKTRTETVAVALQNHLITIT
jgi:two-component system, NarL family, response regulator LiaR